MGVSLRRFAVTVTSRCGFAGALEEEASLAGAEDCSAAAEPSAWASIASAPAVINILSFI